MLQGRRQTEQRVTGLLQSLGDDADTVAANLAREGVTGFRSQSRNCAIARYLGAVVGSDPGVGVITVSQTAVCINGTHWWSPKIRRSLPHAIRQFIIGFDTGRYPQLLAAEPGRRPVRRAVKPSPEAGAASPPAADPSGGHHPAEQMTAWMP